ncbi:TPA: LysR family transcriptional regulator [Morganella morganii]|uniref:LysR family transcriptional regulator n=1 Tax=Morganella morganii TaxID=582 RepID=UPI00163A2F00|nr:LysR family transcriptional regulator [Morganella morganii]HEI8862499.1 LysR family transcriptional regulator [Morganella morganii]
MMIEFRHLRYFIAVAEELHFGRAAERLNISQPPLSQQIQALENAIPAKLLARNNRNVSLTPAGEMFLREAYQIRTQVEAAVEKAARMDRGELGEVSVGFTSTTPFMRHITATFRQYREIYPDVAIHMHQMNTKQQINPLLSGRIDFGVMRNTQLPDNLVHELLFKERFMLAVYDDHPLMKYLKTGIPLEMLTGVPLVFFERDVGTALYDEIINLLKKAGVTPVIAQEAGEAMTILGLVSAGLGISLVTESFTRMKVDGVRYIHLAENQAFSEVWLVYHKHNTLSPAGQRLIEMLKNNVFR